MILDVHTHHAAPQSEAVVSYTPRQEIAAGQARSVGFHPWEASPSETEWRRLEELARASETLFIGEAGVDRLRGADVAEQTALLRRHVELAEELRKPLMVHCVRAADVLLRLRREMRPSQPWILHGFRGGEAQARQLLDAGLHLSFGERFNVDALRMALREAPERSHAETDESPLSITEIIRLHAAAAGVEAAVLSLGYAASAERLKN